MALATSTWAEDVPKPIPFPPTQQGGGMNHMGHENYAHGMHAMETVGDLEISGFYSRETLPNAPVAGGFMTITNNGSTDDRLIAAIKAIPAQGHEIAEGVCDIVLEMRALRMARHLCFLPRRQRGIGRGEQFGGFGFEPFDLCCDIDLMIDIEFAHFGNALLKTRDGLLEFEIGNHDFALVRSLAASKGVS